MTNHNHYAVIDRLELLVVRFMPAPLFDDGDHGRTDALRLYMVREYGPNWRDDYVLAYTGDLNRWSPRVSER